VKNKVQVSRVLLKIFLLLNVLISTICSAPVSAQTKKKDTVALVASKPADELKIRQRGTELQLQFPKMHFRSALKIINNNGAVMKALMIDEGMETASVSVSGLHKGIYQCIIENRTQRFGKKILLQ